MSKPKYLITNLVYGDTYTKLFCNNHVKSLLDETNIPAIAKDYDIEYMIFTDETTLRTIAHHPNVVALSKLIKISSYIFRWPNTPGVNKFQYRYSLILDLVKNSIRKGIDENALVTCWVADLVVAKEFFPRIMSRMEDGHGAVFVLPLRSASEAITPVLNQQHFALKDLELCALGFECLHPLWVACNWNNPQFTKLPFTLLWSGQGGLLARSFSTTPIIFKPTAKMLEGRGMIDGDIPGMCDNPYWCTNWTDAPVIGVEPLICYYPPFANRPSSVQWVSDWTKCIDPTQIPLLTHRLFYPHIDSVTLTKEISEQSDKVVREIIQRVTSEEMSA